MTLGFVDQICAGLTLNSFLTHNLSTKRLQKWLDELTGHGFIMPFEGNGESYFHIKHFKRHQVINRPSKFRNPQPPSITEDSVSTHGIISDGSGIGSGNGKGMEVEVEARFEGKPEEEQPKVNPSFLFKGKEETKTEKTYYPDEALSREERMEREKAREREKDRQLKEARTQGII